MAKGASGEAIDILSNEQVKALLAAPNIRYVTSYRNKVILQTMLHAGLRVGEVVHLEWSHIIFDENKLKIINGKRGKNRKVYINETFKEALLNWKQKQKDTLGYKPTYIFTSMSKGMEGRQLTPRYIQQMLNRYLKRAGIELNISPHNLRHTYATRLYEETGDLYFVRDALGHKDISTTTIYAKLADGRYKEALVNFNIEE